MKKLIYIFMLAGIFFFGSCYKQFEEDPKSVKWMRFKKRFIGKWELTKLAIDGNDVSSLMYVDSLKIYTQWHIKDYERNDRKIYSSTNTTFELKTHDGKLVLDNSKNAVLRITWINSGNKVNDPETKEVNLYFASRDSTIVSEHKFSKVNMRFKKLTKDEMHLQTKEYDYTILNYHYYDMYFIKKQ